MTPVSNTNAAKAGGMAGVASVSVDAAAIAERFLSARRAAEGLGAYPGDMPDSLDEAYRIQDEAIAAWAKPVLGWKVGRIADSLMDHYGADRLAGPIFSVVEELDRALPDMPVFAQGFAAGEAEFLLRVVSEPPANKMSFTLEEAAALIGAVHIGIEIASSPLATINEIGPTAVISDFGNNNGLLVGPAVPNWRSSGFEDWEVVTSIDGAEVGRGRARSFPDGAIGSARFLFELMARRGIRIRAGQWISSGAVTGVHDAVPGQTVECRFGDRLEIGCRLIAAKPDCA